MKNFFSSKKGIIITAVSAAALLLLAVVLLLIFGQKNPPVVEAGTEPTSSLHSSSQVVEQKLEITSHKDKDTTTTVDTTCFVGSCDPAFPLLLNGEAVECDENGVFTVEKALKVGANTFTFSHKGEEITYTVRYRFVVIESYSPSGKQTYDSGSAFSVTVRARKGSVVTAAFGGKTITLTEVMSNEEIKNSDFTTYGVSFSLPDGNTQNKNLGKVTYSAKYKEYSETYRSGDIICKKANIPVIAEVVSFSAETFDGDGTNGLSRPTNTYLPAGTVDYITGTAYSGDIKYYRLRYGKSVAANKKLSPGNQKVVVTREYAGSLPETNTLSVAKIEQSKRFTTITLDTQWKAPFTLSLLPQAYKNPAIRDYTVTAVTCEYVEIKFCYAAQINGAISFKESNPLFTHGKTVKSGKDYILRLYLRRKGQFYGWDAAYNSSGQLVFTFLHPTTAKPAANAYGVDLSGVKILIDVGHGGIDSGAVGINGLLEKERNMNLSLKIKAQLESIGATVVMNRTTDKTLDSDARCKFVKTTKPDLCIAVHHDSSTSTKPNGFAALHFTLFSSLPTKYVYNSTVQTGIYNAPASQNRNRFQWHYYYVARMTDCPVVLTENGFMTGNIDRTGIASESVNVSKAKAIVKGVAQYFKEISLEIKEETPLPPVSSSAPPSSSEPPPSTSEQTPSEDEPQTSVSSPTSSDEDAENSQNQNTSEEQNP